MKKRKTSHKKRPVLVFSVILLFILLSIPFLWYQNNSIQTDVYSCGEGKHTLRIAQISDLHEKDFKGVLTSAIIAQSPDIVVITGDLLDSDYPNDFDLIRRQLSELSAIAPVYYVTGNHEILGYSMNELREVLTQTGCVFLENASSVIEKDGVNVNLIGLAEKFSVSSQESNGATSYITESITPLISVDMPDILLAHHPEFFETYSLAGVDLVLSGHAHGGQIRIFGHGLFAPGQGIFPKFTQGVHMLNDTEMVISRGLGASVFPTRLFNRPELVIVDFSFDNQ